MSNNCNQSNEVHELITIGIPVYNMENSVCRAIDSCLMQTYKNIEILVVDDKSTDNSVKIIKNKYKKEIKNGKIIVYERKKNGGVNMTMCDLIKEGNGKYISFLDADDFNYPDRIEKQYNAIKNAERQYPDRMIACFCGSHVLCNNFGRIYELNLFPDDLFGGNFGGGTGHSMYKIDDLKKNGGFDKNCHRSSDAAMCVKMLQNNCFYAMVHKPLFQYNFVWNEKKANESVKENNLYFDKLQKFFKKTSNNKYLDNFFGVYRKVFEFKLLWLIPFITIYYKCGRSIYICCIFGIPIIKYTSIVALLNNIKIKQCELFGLRIYQKASFLYK